ncbi:MAG: dihydrofolate reductase family protein [Gaiellaceae bacterium]
MSREPAPLELLWEESGLPSFDLPRGLADRYGGSLGFERPRLVTNFVASVDGVVAIPALPRSIRIIGGGSDSDRFVMALLRACADVVLVGAGTLRASPASTWTAAGAYPDLAPELAELRRRRGLPEHAELAVLSASGSLDPEHPALAEHALVLTTERGAKTLRRRLPQACEIVVLHGEEAIDVTAAVQLLREREHELILSEAGPHVFGSLLAADLVDELFLTLAPLLAGRSSQGGRLGLVEEMSLLPLKRVEGRLLGVRRAGAELFLRYELGRAEGSGEPA